MYAAINFQELRVSRCIKAVAALVLATSVQLAVAATVESPKGDAAKAAAPKGEPSTADPANAQPSTGKSTKAETAKADENRKKPLQRCDQLAEKAQQDCLEKARQRIVEARKKREASGDKGATPRPKSAEANTSGAKDGPTSR
jgi:hypothetical protein